MVPPKVLLTTRWPEAAEQAILSHFNVDIIGRNKAVGEQKYDISAWLDEYDFICPTITDRIDRDSLQRGGFRTRALCNFGAGINHIDLSACQEVGIIVTNTPDVLTNDTADIAIMLTLMAARRAGQGERLVRRGGWDGWSPTHLLGLSLTGKTLGLIGFGRIGQAMAGKAYHAFGMQIIYHSRTRHATEDLPVPARYEPLDKLLRSSDVIALHAPGGPETRHIIDVNALAKMKSSVILVNTARGDLIDDDALIDALKSGRIAAAGLDVFQGEPQIHRGYLELDNVVLLPHLGSATVEARTAMGFRALRNLQAIVAGEPIPDRVA